MDGSTTPKRTSDCDASWNKALLDNAARPSGALVYGAQKGERLVVPDFGVLEGPFLVAALEYAGEHEEEATFALSLASAGEIGFSAI